MKKIVQKYIKLMICKLFHKKYHKKQLFCDSMGEWIKVNCLKCNNKIC